MFHKTSHKIIGWLTNWAELKCHVHPPNQEIVQNWARDTDMRIQENIARAAMRTNYNK